MTSIRERPAAVDGRLVPGHWEGDLIKGAGNRSSVGTLVERTSRKVVLVKLADARAETAREGFAAGLLAVPARLRLTLTYDQGQGELWRNLGDEVVRRRFVMSAH